MIDLDTLDRDTALRGAREYAEKALDAAWEYDRAKRKYGSSAQVTRQHATDAQVYGAVAAALGVALETGAIR